MMFPPRSNEYYPLHSIQNRIRAFISFPGPAWHFCARLPPLTTTHCGGRVSLFTLFFPPPRSNQPEIMMDWKMSGLRISIQRKINYKEKLYMYVHTQISIMTEISKLKGLPMSSIPIVGSAEVPLLRLPRLPKRQKRTTSGSRLKKRRASV